MWINIVEDEETLNVLMKTYLEKEGYNVRSFLNGNDAVEAITTNADLWVIDIMLPYVNGFTIYNKLKSYSPDTYVIFISARNKDIDRVVGLEMGCDDYISKPFMTQELIIRVNKLLKAGQREKHTLKTKDCEIHLERHKVFVDNREVEMSSKEYELLIYFVKNPNIALSRGQILDHIWADSYEGSSRVVDDTVRRIRKKIPSLTIETIYGYGYTYEQG